MDDVTDSSILQEKSAVLQSDRGERLSVCIRLSVQWAYSECLPTRGSYPSRPEQLCCIDSIAIGPPPDTERRGFALGVLKLPCALHTLRYYLSHMTNLESNDSKL